MPYEPKRPHLLQIIGYPLLLIFGLTFLVTVVFGQAGQATRTAKSDPTGVACTANSPILLYQRGEYTCESSAYALTRPPQNWVRSDIASKSLIAGVEFTTCGYAACGDKGGATYKVFSTASPYTAEGYGAITLANSNVAIMQPTNGVYNALAFGVVYHASTDSTAALQRALDFQGQNAKSGEVFLDEDIDTSKFVNISTVYVRNGNRLRGKGYNSTRTSSTVTVRYGTRIKVASGGKGLVVGESSHSVLNTVIDWEISYLTILGQSGAVSGIRLGSDVTYKGAAQHGKVHHAQVRDFTDSGVTQPIYDKSTEALGSLDAGYYGTFAVTGAAGIFVSNNVNTRLEEVVLENNYYGLAESSGGQSTTLVAEGGYWSQNIEAAVYLTTLKSSKFSHIVIEGQTQEAIKLIIPATATTQLRSQMYGIWFNECHFEQNSLERRDTPALPKTYTFYIENENAGSSVRDVFINSSVSSAYGHGIYSNRGRNVVITGRVDVSTGDNAIVATNSEDCFYTNEIQSTAVFTLDSEFLLTRQTGQFSGLTSGRVPYITTGGTITDAATLTYNGTTSFTLGTGSSNAANSFTVTAGGTGTSRYVTNTAGGSGFLRQEADGALLLRQESGSDGMYLDFYGSVNLRDAASSFATKMRYASNVFSFGANGATNPALQIDSATASVATGVKITGAAAGGNVAIAATSSGSNESLQLSSKGTGIVLVGDTGTASATGGAATLNAQRGTITSEALTTAAGASYTLTLTNSKITASSMIFVSFTDGTNTAGTLELGKVTSGSGSATIIIRNSHSADALNGTIKINFLVM